MISLCIPPSGPDSDDAQRVLLQVRRTSSITAVLQFDLSTEVLTGKRFRELRDQRAAWIEIDQPRMIDRTRAALALSPDEPGLVLVPAFERRQQVRN